MQQVTIDIDKLSDSQEVYDSRPNPIIKYFIYLILIIFLVAGIWMSFSKIDIVVKSSAVFKDIDAMTEVYATVNGSVKVNNLIQGKQVNKGDVLLEIDSSVSDQSLQDLEQMLTDIDARIEILNAYTSALLGDNTKLNTLENNKYYQEFKSKKKSLDLTNETSVADNISKKEQIESDVNNTSKKIAEQQNQLYSLQILKKSIQNKKNEFTNNTNLYMSIFNHFISSYNLSSNSYDDKIDTLKLEKIRTTDSAQIATIDKNIATLTSEKKNTLDNLVLQKIMEVDSQINTVMSNLNTLQGQKESLNNQLSIISNSAQKNTKELNILAEQKNVFMEIVASEEKKKDILSKINQHKIQKDKSKIIAETTGVIFMEKELNVGSYLSEGTKIGNIIPDNKLGLYAEIYVENADIGQLKIGQKINFEVSAFDSSKYGNFTGNIIKISRDVIINEQTGKSYYIVEAKLDDSSRTDRFGNQANLMNGMAAQAKIITDEQSVLEYFLRKLDLLD